MSKRRSHVVQVNVPVPPPDPRPYVPAICLPCAREVAFLALHDRVCGFLMHWVNDQPIPHPRERQWCAGCRLGQTPRWQGFIGVISLNTMNRFILKVPASAFRESGEFRDRSDAGTLAGTVFTGWRFGKTRQKTSPAVIELVQQQFPTPKMNPFPLFPALCRWWKIDTLKAIDQVQRPEDAEKKAAADFVEFAKRINAQRRQGKGASS